MCRSRREGKNRCQICQGPALMHQGLQQLPQRDPNPVAKAFFFFFWPSRHCGSHHFAICGNLLPQTKTYVVCACNRPVYVAALDLCLFQRPASTASVRRGFFYVLINRKLYAKKKKKKIPNFTFFMTSSYRDKRSDTLP